jgi:mono/diheme cytochrome c family protein
MRRKLTILVSMVVLIGGAALWLLTNPHSIEPSELPAHLPAIANGRTMFLAGGCGSCHATTGQDDQTRLGGGLALKSYFGTFYAPNISPDRKDGIGAWTEAQFISAIVNGSSPDGRHYYPAFPYTSYQRMSYADVRDLFAYLMTLPPVSGKVRDHELSFPYHIRRVVGVWKLLYVDGRPFKPDPMKSAEWNRGAYLVNGPGHCAECHSPRNRLGAILDEYRFAGGALLDEEGWVPNISRKRLDEWTENDFAYLLETGMTPDGDAVGSHMASVARNTALISPADRLAMAVYLKSLPVVDSPRSSQKK